MENISRKIIENLVANAKKKMNESYGDNFVPDDVLMAIQDMINSAKEKAGVSDDLLLDNGAIYYMNANDGTEFDWGANDRSCEFFVFYKEDEMGFCKVWVSRDNKLEGYYYTRDDIQKGKQLPSVDLESVDYSDTVGADFTATCLMVADNKGLYDEDIKKIPWDAVIPVGRGGFYLGDEDKVDGEW